MLQRADIQLRSIIKSLNDAVAPAIDPENALANEQLQLALAMLSMMRDQLPMAYAFDCNELTRLTKLADNLGELGGDECKKQLQPLIDSSKELIQCALALDPADVTAKVQEMRNSISDATAKVYMNGGEAIRSQLTKLVTDATSEQLLRERAWVLAQGWEDDPNALPPLEALLNDHHVSDKGH